MATNQNGSTCSTDNGGPFQEVDEPYYNATETSLTPRALLAGLFIGLLINLSNTYYGLRIGFASQMSMVSGLLGYAWFQITAKYTTTPFTISENVLLISIATAAGCMPVTAGFIGIIPALEYLIGPGENGPLRVSLENLIIWSMALSFFGLIFASLFREHFVMREKLPWPGAKATSQLLKTLHYKPGSLPTSSQNATALLSGDSEQERTEPEPLVAQNDELDWTAHMNALVWSASVSGIWSTIMYFVPRLHELPIFGHEAANKWLWSADVSPGFIGQGIITGPIIPLHMLTGAIVGWAILSPYAKHRGWAPGEVDNWENGSRGWIIWVSLAVLLADASVKLCWFIVRPFWRAIAANEAFRKRLMSLWNTSIRKQQAQPLESEYVALLEDDTDIGARAQRDEITQSDVPKKVNSPSEGSVHMKVLGLGFLASVVVCVAAIQLIFNNIMPWYYTLLAVALSLPMAAVAIRSLAETDYNPESALVSQLAFATLISHSNPNGIIINLLSAAVAQAGANQAGDLAYDLKIGHMVGARPAAQLRGQIIGSLFGALISCGIYKLYASQYPIPGPLFPVPSSFLVLSTARLVMGRGLPEGVAPFALTAAVLSALVTVVKMRYAARWWQNLIPGGVAFAIGIYLPPSFTITRALGGIFCWDYKRRSGGRENNIVVLASGLVLGESLASLVSLVLTAMNAPQVGGK